ncbi:MAG: CobW family GTP-binding protein [Acetobacteraceae bacterium]
MTGTASVRPVSVVTGFLGSGKTTLIGRVLADPAFARTAVIVNEWGEVGIDHALIAAGSETLLALTTGCLCCRMQGDLATTLHGLAAQARQAGLADYDRVLIETSGLVDPAPILAALLADPDVTAAHRLDSVVTLVDAIAGAATLDRHVEARRQVAVADRIVLTKTDLAGPAPALRARLAATAPVLDVVRGAIDPALLFAPADPARRAALLAALPPAPRPDPFSRRRHAAGLVTIVLERDRPVAGAALSLFMEALVANAGPRLLRLKGLVEIAERPGRPLVLQAVQHSLAPPEWLDGWPPGWDGASRLVLIGDRLPPHFPARLLAAIEAEVAEAAVFP